ncbi:MarR family winged helix-turn-helix transcriptional regulator [Novosphingobium album (ex Liu et al. 2023)]|uniref:Helix-turn-helix domain-containing protein n=1 Tax=Novosphingobium album (ex Liu et al. 2023) TaxID=3031130 RepID=A0ABT5WUI2_9SPHN|nr:helix-turn-helix domain-containing protein [Novosphingobium album (ex Liu et al. 2023)]MDE8653519.1 helix-turn-helix domain-containing protein [Novosphingobium album (ex Liu et al. 2023)]
MERKFASRHPLVGLVDETSRLHGRLKSAFAAARQSVGLGPSESMVLNAVVEAERPPTVAQIGRSLGFPRQIVQRAANALRDAGLLEAADNPDHKRAALLVPTERGIALKRQADAMADAIAEELIPALDMQDVHEAIEALHKIRKQLEARLRAR